MSGFEQDGKSVANNFILNLVSLVLFQKVIAPYVTSPEDSDVIKMLKAAGVVTGIEELKAILACAGYDLRVFK